MEALAQPENKNLDGLVLQETADIETSSEDYARRFSGAVGAWFLKVQEEATLQMLKPYPGASVLDVGGGHGQITGPLLENGFEVTVLGSDEVCVQRVKTYLDHPAFRFRTGNVVALPYHDCHFDVVISYRLLPHVTQWERLLSELARVARYAVIVDYPESFSFNLIAPQLFSFKKQLEGNTRPFTCFRRSQLEQVFARAGFQVTDWYPEFFLPMVLHRKLNSVGISTRLENFFRAVGGTRLFGSPVILKAVRQGG